MNNPTKITFELVCDLFEAEDDSALVRSEEGTFEVRDLLDDSEPCTIVATRDDLLAEAGWQWSRKAGKRIAKEWQAEQESLATTA